MSLSSRDTRLLAGHADSGRQLLHLPAEQRSAHAASLRGRVPIPQSLRTVGDIMSPELQSISPDAPIRDLARLMQRNVSTCVVMVERGRLAGIVTQRDMIRLLAMVLDDSSLWGDSIRSHMSRPVHCLPRSASLHDAQRIFEAQGFNHIPVVNPDGRPVGLLSREQLAEALMDLLEKERNAIERQVYNRSRELQRANRQLQALALEDSLLKIGNRRALEIDAQSMHMNAVRHQHPYSLALLDVDYFKRYNDHYGHCAGDHALIAIVDCLKESLRRGDRLYRYGGEELLLMMPETSQAEAVEAVWRVVKNLYQLNMEHRASPYGRLTISGGVSTFTVASVGLAWSDVLEQADNFLYQAKALGRNRVHGTSGENSVPKTHLF